MGAALAILPPRPALAHHRPTPRGRYYARTLPVALVAGVVAGVVVVAAPFHPLLTVLAIWGVAIWRLVRSRRRAHSIARRNDEAQALLAAGDVDDAGRIFEELCQQGQSLPAFHSMLVYNRAVTFLRAGDLEVANSLLHAVLDAGWFTQNGSAFGTYLPMLYGALSVCAALGGRLEEAKHWRNLAHGAVSRAKEGSLLAVDLLVDARAGDFPHVLEHARAALPRAENLLTASQLRLVHLLQAFALERMGGAKYRSVSPHAEIDRHLAFGRPNLESEVAHIIRHWAAFAEFAERHQILAGAERDA